MNDAAHSNTPPRSPPRSAWRWVRRRLFPPIATLGAFLGLALLALWLTGRVLTDRYHWSQYVWWVPTLWLLVPAAALFLLSTLAARLATRVAALFLRALLLVALIAAAAWFALVECRLVRLAPPAGDDPVRVIAWNMASDGMWRESGDWIADHHPDLVVLANTPRTVTRARIMEGFAHVLDDLPNPLDGDPPATHHAFVGRFELFSRLPVRRTGYASIPIPPSARTGWRAERAPAQVAFVQLDTPHGPLTVWMVDLPSSPRLHRLESVRAAAAAARAWAGPAFVTDPDTGFTRAQPLPDDQPPGFPPADLLVGDFNTPRGSASIDLLRNAATPDDTPPLADAHAQAGVGPDWTWNLSLRLVPEQAWWAIDLAYVGPRFAAARFQALHPPATGRFRPPHHPVLVDLVPAP